MEVNKQIQAYELQKVDCNCNDCHFLQRDLEKYNKEVAEDKVNQAYFFKLKKERAIKNALLNKSEEKRDAALKEANAMKYQYQGQRLGISYGECKKFEKAITFLAGTCQLETQSCFKHRLDALSELERRIKLKMTELFPAGTKMYWKKDGSPSYEKLPDGQWVSLDSTYLIEVKDATGKVIDHTLHPETDKPLYKVNKDGEVTNDLNRFGFKWDDQSTYNYYKNIMTFQ